MKNNLQENVELNSIVNQVVSNCSPEKIILFGSRATNKYTKDSDFDLCVISKSNNKRKTLTELYCNVDSEIPIDFLLYTPTEWQRSITDKCSFGFQINKEGVTLYGR